MIMNKFSKNILKVAGFAYLLSTSQLAYAENAFYTLGTMGGPYTAPDRSQPSNLLVVDGIKVLIDVGDGTAGQLSKVGYQADKIDIVFISHLHFDHMGGLFAILGLRTQTVPKNPLQIYGPPGIKKVVAGLIEAMEPSLESGYGNPNAPRITPESIAIVHEINADIPIKLDNFNVEFAENNHYSFASGSPEFEKFKSLAFRFNLKDRSIVYSGDTGPSSAVETLANGADLFIAEMIDLEATIKKIKLGAPNISEKQLNFIELHLRAHHLTPTDLGIMANKSNVKKLIITHFAPDVISQTPFSSYIKTIKEEYSGSVEFAQDIDKY